MMDVYDFVYEEVRRNTSSFRRHELTAIHEAVSCLSPAGGNLALGYLPEGFSRLGLTPVLCLVNATMSFSSQELSPPTWCRVCSLLPILLFSDLTNQIVNRKKGSPLSASLWCNIYKASTLQLP